MSQKEKKQKLLNKYLNPILSTKSNNHSKNISENNVWIHDQDDLKVQVSSQSQSESEVEQEKEKRRVRVQSSDEEGGEQNQPNKKERQQREKIRDNCKKQEERQAKKDKKIKKKLRKALGLERDGEVQEFLQNLQVQGINKQQILDYLHKNKSAIIKKQEVGQQPKKKKKKKDKKQVKQQFSQKFIGFQNSQSSDLQIPQQARTKTIYRNKDGTIKNTSHKQQKQQHQKKVYEKLAEWQKGMKKQEHQKQQQNEHEDVVHAENNKIWNDPMKRWENTSATGFLSCKYDGPPNRYNIRPGFRWDGVIRGNGFENRYLQEINLKKAKKDKEHMDYMKDL